MMSAEHDYQQTSHSNCSIFSITDGNVSKNTFTIFVMGFVESVKLSITEEGMCVTKLQSVS